MKKSRIIDPSGAQDVWVCHPDLEGQGWCRAIPHTGQDAWWPPGVVTPHSQLLQPGLCAPLSHWVRGKQNFSCSLLFLGLSWVRRAAEGRFSHSQLGLAFLQHSSTGTTDFSSLLLLRAWEVGSAKFLLLALWPELELIWPVCYHIAISTWKMQWFLQHS